MKVGIGIAVICTVALAIGILLLTGGDQVTGSRAIPCEAVSDPDACQTP